jgi:hypothetical protein
MYHQIQKKYTVTPITPPHLIWLHPHLAPIKVCEEKHPNLGVFKCTATNFSEQTVVLYRGLTVHTIFPGP